MFVERVNFNDNVVSHKKYVVNRTLGKVTQKGFLEGF